MKNVMKHVHWVELLGFHEVTHIGAPQQEKIKNKTTTLMLKDQWKDDDEDIKMSLESAPIGVERKQPFKKTGERNSHITAQAETSKNKVWELKEKYILNDNTD